MRQAGRLKGGRSERGVQCLYLLVAGDGVHELDVQFRVVLSQRLVSVVTDELHHRTEGKRVRETVLAITMVDLY